MKEKRLKSQNINSACVSYLIELLNVFIFSFSLYYSTMSIYIYKLRVQDIR